MFFITILATAYAITASLRQSQLKSQLALKQEYEKDIDNVNEIAQKLAYAGGGLDISSEEVQELIKQIKLSLYPIGSIYKTTSSTNPSESIGGTWECILTDYDKIYVGSQNIYNEWSTNVAKKEAVIGAYNQLLINVFGDDLVVPSGYTKKISCSAQIRTWGANSYVKIYLNNKLLITDGTYSYDTYRAVCQSDLYSLDEIGLETTLNYSSDGINLYLENTINDECSIRNVTIHGYLVSNDIYYTWKRIQ